MTKVLIEKNTNKAYININGEKVYIDKCLKRSKLKSLLSAKTKVKKRKQLKFSIPKPLLSVIDPIERRLMDNANKLNNINHGTYPTNFLSNSSSSRPSMSSLSTSEQRKLEQERRELLTLNKKKNKIVDTIIPTAPPNIPDIKLRNDIQAEINKRRNKPLPKTSPKTSPNQIEINNEFQNIVNEINNRYPTSQESDDILRQDILDQIELYHSYTDRDKPDKEITSVPYQYYSKSDNIDYLNNMINQINNNEEILTKDKIHIKYLADEYNIKYKKRHIGNVVIDILNVLDPLIPKSPLELPVFHEEPMPQIDSPIQQTTDQLIDPNKELTQQEHQNNLDLINNLLNKRSLNTKFTVDDRYDVQKLLDKYFHGEKIGSTISKKQLLNIKKEIINIIKSGSGKKESVDKDGLSNFQIDKLMKKYGDKYLGTISHDEIPTILSKIKPHSSGGFVINTDPSTKEGKHWQAVYFDGNKDMEIDFYDSFGDPPSNTIMKGVKQIADKLQADNYLKFKNNKIKQQNDRTSNCGFFAAKFLIDRFAGKHFTQASGFDDSVKGEKDIKKFREQHGYGPWQYIKSFAKKAIDVGKEVVNRVSTAIIGKTNAPPGVRSLMAKHGNAKVIGLQVARSPVQKIISSILNAISGGQLEENRRKLNYDEIYHLFLIVHLDDGYSFKIERNETVQISSPNVSNAEILEVPVNSDITLNQLIENGANGKSNFWNYNPVTSNCQQFVTDLLSGSRLLSGEASSFINQNAVALLEGSPVTRKIAEVVGDLGSRLNTLIHGAARKKRKLTCKDITLGVDKRGNLTAKKKGGCCDKC